MAMTERIRIAELAREERVMGSDSARAVGRFRQAGTLGYRAATAPTAPIRETRVEAMEDERAWLDALSGSKMTSKPALEVKDSREDVAA